MSSGYRGDVIGRVLGAIVFIGGVVLLGVVFRLAYGLFMTNADQALGLVFTGNPKLDPPAIKIGMYFGWLILRIALLFILAISGSLIAQKGINLYFSSIKHAAVDLLPKIMGSSPHDSTP